MSLYEVAFSGELMPGFEDAQVRANLARLFQADDQRIAALFSGRRVVIKSGLEEAAAEKYRLTLARAGALVRIGEVGAGVAGSVPAPAQAPAPAPAAPQKSSSNLPELQVVPRDGYMAAFQSVKAPDFGLAATGDDLQDSYRKYEQRSVDLSAMSLAPAGSDMNQLKDDRAPVAPDISHLKLVD